MAGQARMKIEGIEEARQMMKHLPDAVQRSVLLNIMRKSTKPLINNAKSNISGYSMKLAKSIGNITGKSKKYPTIHVGPRAKGSYKEDGWFGHFVEFGVKGIIGKKKKGGYKRQSDNEKFAVWVGKIKAGSQYRKDQPARPFMRPAIDATQGEIKRVMTEDIIKLIDKAIAKYNKRKNR